MGCDVDVLSCLRMDNYEQAGDCESDADMEQQK